MLNKKSDFLVILVATYNRLGLLKHTLASIASHTRCSHEVIVIDGGSTDGTIEYLEGRHDLQTVFQGRLLGPARAYNEVWRQIESKYTCWLSDDTEVVDRCLDLAVNILERHREIGLVGLKMKDTIGEWQYSPYMGGISEYGILNCNHGVLPMALLRSVGFFNEDYRFYNIDPDLTASVLSAGRYVVMTKQISVLHHRQTSTSTGNSQQVAVDNTRIYHDKFQFLGQSLTTSVRLRRTAIQNLSRLLYYHSGPESLRFGLNRRDWAVLAAGRFVRLWDPLASVSRPYHLLQRLPSHLLASERNPCRHVAERVDAMLGA